MEHVIDAKGKSLGRVASQAALLLRGKNETTWRAHKLPDSSVKIVNAKGLNINPKKREGKLYRHYSGYPGGQKVQTLGELITKKGEGEALRKAIYGMLPGNRLRPIMMKRLKIEN